VRKPALHWAEACDHVTKITLGKKGKLP